MAEVPGGLWSCPVARWQNRSEFAKAAQQGRAGRGRKDAAQRGTPLAAGSGAVDSRCNTTVASELTCGCVMARLDDAGRQKQEGEPSQPEGQLRPCAPPLLSSGPGQIAVVARWSGYRSPLASHLSRTSNAQSNNSHSSQPYEHRTSKALPWALATSSARGSRITLGRPAAPSWLCVPKAAPSAARVGRTKRISCSCKSATPPRAAGYRQSMAAPSPSQACALGGQRARQLEHVGEVMIPSSLPCLMEVRHARRSSQVRE